MVKRIFSYCGAYKHYVFLSPVFVMLETAGELALPLLIAKIIDDGIMTGNLSVIYRIGLYMLLLAIAAVFLGAFGAKFGSYGSIGIGANIRRAEFEKISRFSFADIDRFSSASLITRLTNDITNIQNFTMMMIRMMFRTLTMIVVSLVVLFTMEWRLALILVAAIPIIGGAIGLLMYKCHPLFELMQSKIDAMNEKVQENLVGIRVVKSYVREEFEQQKFQTANDEFTRLSLKAVLTVILQQPIMMMGITTVTALVLYFGGHMVLSGNLEVGTLSSIVTYIFNILISIMMLAMVLLQYVRASACAKRIFEVIDTEPSIQDGADLPSDLPAPQGKVEFGTCASATPATTAATTERTCSAASASPPNPARCWPSWGHRHGQILPGQPDSPASTTSPAARCCWMGWTCGTIRWKSCGSASAWCCKTMCCSPAPSGKTCSGATPTPPRNRSSRPPRTPRPMTLS